MARTAMQKAWLTAMQRKLQKKKEILRRAWLKGYAKNVLPVPNACTAGQLMAMPMGTKLTCKVLQRSKWINITGAFEQATFTHKPELFHTFVILKDDDGEVHVTAGVAAAVAA